MFAILQPRALLSFSNDGDVAVSRFSNKLFESPPNQSSSSSNFGTKKSNTFLGEKSQRFSFFLILVAAVLEGARSTSEFSVM